MISLEKRLKRFTIEDIRSWGPCYDPSKYLSADWSGTVLDILDLKDCPFQDRLWVVLRTDLVSEKLMRLFAVWCARQMQHLMKDLMKDPRSIAALDMAERFANGESTLTELAAAPAAVLAAAWDAWAAALAAAPAAPAAVLAAALAWDAALAAQEAKLREMILAGIETGDSVCV